MKQNLFTRQKKKHVCKHCLAYARKYFVRSYALESSFSELVTKGLFIFELNTNILSETCFDIDLYQVSSYQSETDKPADDLENMIEYSNL